MNTIGVVTADPAPVAAASSLRAHIVVRRPHFTVDVAFQVSAGETVAVMGPSGAGKSTLLQALAGLVPLRAGEVAVGDRLIDRVTAPRLQTVPMDRGIVLLGQDARLFPHLSVRENVAFGLRAARTPAARARRAADEWLDRVGLPGAGGRAPGELSGGEQQRVAVARALAASPRVVLLDEPLVGLDPQTASAIRGMLRDQLVATTTVAVTHDAADAVALADRMLIVEAGREVQSGPVREVLAAPASAFVAAVAGLNRVAGVAAEGGWRSADADAGGGHLLVSADRGSVALASMRGAALAAVFRPEHVRIAIAEAEQVNTWRTVVERVEPSLAGARVWTPSGVLDVRASDADHLSPGDEIRLQIDPSHVRFVRWF